MAMDWLVLTLVCALGVATADAATKALLADRPARELVLVRFTVPGLLLLPVLLAQPWPALTPAFWGWLAVLVPLELIAMGLYVTAIATSALAHTLPYLAFTPVFTLVTAWLVLGERVSAAGAAGIVLVTAGAWVLNAEHAFAAGERRLLAPFGYVLRERGPRLMLAVAAIYSATSVGGKALLALVPAPFLGSAYFLAVGLAALAGVAVRGREAVAVVWRRPGACLAVGVPMAVMVLTHFLALERVEVAYMISVKRLSLVFGILYGAWLFHERQWGKNTLAAAVMVAGAALIVLSPEP